MYHPCRVTLQHDKIYALLGLSADGLESPALQPDYGLPGRKFSDGPLRILLARYAR